MLRAVGSSDNSAGGKTRRSGRGAGQGRGNSSSSSAQVISLSHFDNGSQFNQLDVVSNVVWTAGSPGGTYPLVTTGKFNTGMLFQGSSGGLSWLEQPGTSAWDFGTKDFTVEFWAWPANLAQNGVYFFKGNTTSTIGPILIRQYNTDWHYLLSSNGTSWNIAVNKIIGTPINQTWQHIALVRQGSTFTGYLNGVAGQTTTSAAALSYTLADPIYLGTHTKTNTSNAYGIIDELRVYMGLAVYTGNFTPPSAPFTYP